MKVLTILGTRPEIIKLSPLIPLLDKEFKNVLVHTGQHYSFEMDKIFFKELDLRCPNYNLNIGSLSAAKQISSIWVGIEEIIIKEKPELVIVFGDTNSTIGGALAASKLHIQLMHIEAGCRSYNRIMPEEINRVVTDHISDYLLAPDEDALNNLLKEGIPEKRIELTGSILVDACFRGKDLSKKSEILDKLRLNEYVLATIHRAENTDNAERLKELLDALNKIAEIKEVVLSCHPRTKGIIEKNNINVGKRIQIINSVGYIDFIKMLSNCKFVMTDSGGVQEEAAVLNVPCLILREETEWVRYVKIGKNIIAGVKKDKIFEIASSLLNNEDKLKKMRATKIEIKQGVSKKIIEIIKNIERKK